MSTNPGEVFPLPDSILLTERSGPIPLYYQLATALEQAITSGQLPPGSRLENEIALSGRLGLSRPTVRRAIQDLVDKGLLVRRRGIGTQVVHGSVTRRIELTSLFDDLERDGKTPATRVLACEVVDADEHIAGTLGVSLEEHVLRIQRLRSADSVPIAVLENYLPPAFTDISADDLAARGLYQILRARGVTMRVARQKIGARRATPSESRLLQLGRGSPVLSMDRTAYDADGRAVEFGHHCYRPDLYSFEMTLVEK